MSCVSWSRRSLPIWKLQKLGPLADEHITIRMCQKSYFLRTPTVLLNFIFWCGFCVASLLKEHLPFCTSWIKDFRFKPNTVASVISSIIFHVQTLLWNGDKGNCCTASALTIVALKVNTFWYQTMCVFSWHNLGFTCFDFACVDCCTLEVCFKITQLLHRRPYLEELLIHKILWHFYLIKDFVSRN